MPVNLMPHEGHERHLCYLHNIGYLKGNFDNYKELVQNPKFICKICGRASKEKINLCYPEEL